MLATKGPAWYQTAHSCATSDTNESLHPEIELQHATINQPSNQSARTKQQQLICRSGNKPVRTHAFSESNTKVISCTVRLIWALSIGTGSLLFGHVYRTRVGPRLFLSKTKHFAPGLPIKLSRTHGCVSWLTSSGRIMDDISLGVEVVSRLALWPRAPTTRPASDLMVEDPIVSKVRGFRETTCSTGSNRQVWPIEGKR